jgi:predicted flap endonuclease-1-like 5' DNA nuclease
MTFGFNSWAMFFAGLLIGWLIEWIIDYMYFRKKSAGATVNVTSEATVRAEAPKYGFVSGAETKIEIDRLKAELDAARATPIQAAAAIPDTSAKDAEIARLKLELEACREKREDLEEELAAFSARTPVVEGGTAKDPLIDIDGIGPVFEKKLWDAGVLTFAQLASTSEERIREIIQPKNWQKIEADKWIAEAAAFARGEKP